MRNAEIGNRALKLLLFTNLVTIHVLPLGSNSLTLMGVKFLLPALLALLFFLLTDVRPNKKYFWIVMAITAAYLLLTFWALLFDVSMVIYQDFFEIPKIFAMTLLTVFSVTIFSRGKVSISFVHLCAGMLLLSSLVYVVFETLNLYDVGVYYLREKGVLNNKGVFSFGNTYFAAAVYLYFTSIFAGLWVVRGGAANFLLFAVASVLVVWTQSRTAFVALMLLYSLMVFTYCYHVMKFNQIAKRRFNTLTLTVALSLALTASLAFLDELSIKFPYLSRGIDGQLIPFLLSGESGGSSLATRVGQLERAFDANQLILIGIGIGKGYFPDLESWFSLYFFRYGLLGMALYAVIWGGSGLLAWKSYKRAYSKGLLSAASFQLSHAIFIIVLPVISLSSVITDQPYLYSIFYTYLGASIGVYLYVRDVKKS